MEIRDIAQLKLFASELATGGRRAARA